jgi:enoyl-CoA hydratase/carnithine racemase
MTDSFLVDATGPVVRIRLNRPEQGNPFTAEMMHTFAGLLREHGESADTRVIALTAEGKTFSIGRDPKEPKPAKEPTAYQLRKTVMAGVLGAYQAIRDTPVPVVACVQGDALGFGAALAGCCDITLVSSAARFAFPEIEHNIPATLGVSAVLSTVPLKAAKWLAYSAETITAEQALAVGLASKVLPAEGFTGACEQVLNTLAAKPRTTLEVLKLYFSKAPGMPPDTASEYAGTLLGLAMTQKPK